MLIMTQPSDDDGNAGSAFDIAAREKPEDMDTGSTRNSVGEQTVTGQAIKAAYEASRNGNPKAFADAFAGAVKSMIGDEIHKILNERDAEKGY